MNTNIITKSQVNFLIESAILIQNLSKDEAIKKVSEYIKENGWIIK